MIQITKTTVAAWQNCYQITTPQLFLTATADVGPRILQFGLQGKRNIFYVDPAEMGLTGGDTWHAYGGHRFWIAPEEKRTLFPDNRGVVVEKLSTGLVMTPPLEETTGFQKTLQIDMSPDISRVHLIHSLRNCAPHTSVAAPWAVTVMAPGGTAILPHSPHYEWPGKLTAQNTLSLWSYTDLSDSRWTFGKRYILLRQIGGDCKPQKIGMYNSEGWVAYLLDGFLFVKFFATSPEKGYPDLNSNLETWTNKVNLELETLGPLIDVQPGQTITHLEDWFLFGDVPAVKDDDDVDKSVLPHIRECQVHLASV